MSQYFPEALPDFHLTKTHVKLLKYAKRRIKQGYNEHVCNALQHGADFPDRSGLLKKGTIEVQNATKDLKRFIRRAIDRKIYFDSWQHKHGIHRTDDEARSDRVKWIKYILNETPGYND
jgi:hypothetical protein